MNIPKNQVITTMILGPSGAGKSRTGNNLLGNNTAFSVGNEGTPITIKCKSQTGERFGKGLHVIDTPGVWGEVNENKKLLDQIKKGLQLSNEGLHVFLLVTEMGCAVDVHKIFLRYQCLFGEKMSKHAIVVFTNLDVWKDRFKDDNGQEPDDHRYVRTLPQDAMNLLKKCGGRYVLFNNKCTGDEMEKQLRNLLDEIAKMIALNKEEVYTEEMMTDRKDQENDMPLRQVNDWIIKTGFSTGICAAAGFFVYSKYFK